MSKEEVDRLAWDIWEAKLMDDDKRSVRKEDSFASPLRLMCIYSVPFPAVQVSSVASALVPV